MCHRCDKQVIEMGILESDRLNLPFKLVIWHCVAQGCRNKIFIKDYGIPPIYYWDVKVRRNKDESWRGGWTDAAHGYICSRHFPEYKKNEDEFFAKQFFLIEGNEKIYEYLYSLIEQTNKKLKLKDHGTQFGY